MPSAPQLDYDAGTMKLNWNIDGPRPEAVGIQKSADGVSNWLPAAVVDGALTSWLTTGVGYYRIQALYEVGPSPGPWSNIVHRAS